MELQFRSASGVCAVSGEPFIPGNRVESILYVDSEGELQRVDIIPEHSSELELDGTILCRWQQTCKEKEGVDDGGKQILQSAEEMFLALNGLLQEDMEIVEKTESSDESKAFNYFLAIMLERKRVLRLVSAKKGIYRHVKLKKELTVEPVDLLAPTTLSVIDKLKDLV
jgi:hypothetical protein